jgi:exosortase/archaeosortase family protein
LAVLLIFLPFITTFNEFLTRVVEKLYFYVYIEDYIVPYLSRLVGVVLIPFGLKVIGTASGLYLPDKSLAIDIAWNCIGWQSMILVIITFVAGLQGQYRNYSKAQTILVGLLGTFLMNILRITSVVLVAIKFGYFPAVIYHDYFSNLLIVLWLFFFWWFSYAYILEATLPGPVAMKRITRLSVNKSSKRFFSSGFARIKNLFSFKPKGLKKKFDSGKITEKGKTKKNKKKARIKS